VPVSLDCVGTFEPFSQDTARRITRAPGPLAVAFDRLAKLSADLELDLLAVTRNSVAGGHVSIAMRRRTAAYSGRQAS
jgi:hypothetical protein